MNFEICIQSLGRLQQADKLEGTLKRLSRVFRLATYKRDILFSARDYIWFLKIAFSAKENYSRQSQPARNIGV